MRISGVAFFRRFRFRPPRLSCFSASGFEFPVPPQFRPHGLGRIEPQADPFFAALPALPIKTGFWMYYYYYYHYLLPTTYTSYYYYYCY